MKKTKKIGFFPLLFISIVFLTLLSCEDEGISFYKKEVATLEVGEAEENSQDKPRSPSSEDRALPPEETPDKPRSPSSEDRALPPEETPDDKGCRLAEDIFTVDGEVRKEKAKLDILWVVDGSGSMNNDKKILAKNFGSFIEKFLKKNVDFKLAVAGVDPYLEVAENEIKVGRYSNESLQKLTSSYAKSNETSFKDHFTSLVKNISSGVYETGLAASRMFLDVHGKKWLRKDAFLIIVYVSDEDDIAKLYPQLVKNTGFYKKRKAIHDKFLKKYFGKEIKHGPADYAQYFHSLKGDDSLVRVYSIVNTNSKASHYGSRYIQVAQATKGSSYNIHSNFDDALSTYSTQIFKLVNSTFALSSTPKNPKQIKVQLNGVASSAWTYQEGSVYFSQGNLSIGDKVNISYKKCDE